MNSVVTYNGAQYVVITAHLSAVGKEPNVATTLWELVNGFTLAPP